MKWIISSLLVVLLSGCVYTDSAIQYAQEGTKRVDSGYKAKLEMTNSVVDYMKTVNVDCGTSMKVENGIPIVNVKQCVDFDDAMKVVNMTPIIQPQKVADVVESAGNFLAKGGSTIVGGLGVYYGYKSTTAQLENSYKTNKDNNKLQQGMWDSYTGTYQNNSVQVVNPEVVTNTDVQVVSPEVVDPTVITNTEYRETTNTTTIGSVTTEESGE